MPSYHRSKSRRSPNFLSFQEKSITGSEHLSSVGPNIAINGVDIKDDVDCDWAKDMGDPVVSDGIMRHRGGAVVEQIPAQN